MSSWSSADELDTSGSVSPTSGRSTPNRQRTVTFHWSFSVGPWEGTLGSNGICSYLRVRRLPPGKQESPYRRALSHSNSVKCRFLSPAACPPHMHSGMQKNILFFKRRRAQGVAGTGRQVISLAPRAITRMVFPCFFGGSSLQTTTIIVHLKK